MQFHLAMIAAVASVPLAVFMVADLISDHRHVMKVAQGIVTRIAESTRFTLDERLKAGAEGLVALTRTPWMQPVDPGRIGPVLKNLKLINRLHGDLAFLDLEGRITASADDAHREAGESHREFDWFNAALQSRTVVTGHPHRGKMTGRWYSVMAYAVRDESGAPVGVLSSPLPLDEILHMVPPHTFSLGAIVTVVNEAGIVVARSGAGESAVGQSAASLGLEPSASGSSGLFSATASLTNTPWTVHATLPKAVVLAGLVEGRNRAVALHGIVLIAVVAGIVFLGRRFSEPLMALSAARRARRAGDRNARAPEEGPREIAAAAAVFNEFATSLAENERDLRASRERYKGLVDSIEGIVWEFDLRGRGLSFLSPQAERIVGFPVRRYFESPRFWIRCLHPEDRKWVPKFCWSRIRKAKDYSFDCRVVAADQRVIWFHNSVHHAQDGGRIVSLQTVMVDITDRKKAEQSMIEGEARYRMLLGAFPDIIFVVNRKGDFLDCLAADPSILLKPLEQIIGRNQREIIPADICDRFDPAYARVLDSGKSEIVSYDLEFPGGTRHFEVRLLPHEPGTLLAVARDVTLLVRTEQEREELDRKIRETQKLESLGILAGGIAHDFNNLLTGILGNATLAREELGNKGPAVDTLTQIEKASLRAADLCMQMLAYSGRGHFVVKLTDLGDLAREMVALLGASVSKKTRLTIHTAPDLPPVQSDFTQIRQVIMNLVINGSEALEEGSGSVSVDVRAIQAGPADFKSADFTGSEAPSRYVRIEVRDTGMGMSAEVLSRVFDPFFTTKFTGRGLGLASVLGIARGHRGAINIESKPGEGTCFQFFLPAATGTVEAAPPVEALDPAWKGSGRVLVVDDEESVVRLVSKVLVKSGFQPVPGANGKEAVDAFLADPDSFVLALIDLTMPVMDGVEALRVIRGKSPTLPAVLMSGYSENEATDRFEGLTLNGFLQKPFSTDQLLAKIRAATTKEPPA